MGDVAKAMRSKIPAHRRKSYRWISIAIIMSIVFAGLLFLAFFLFTVIPHAMNTGKTGWTDYTAAEKAEMKYWYTVILGGGVAIILLFCFLRRRKYAMGV